ncbi:7-deoxyloganetin glucosyltransferase-like [Prunus avium]|uniref:Glycosyltransferase n=1 Tax=Prunus avium TaxID=42229 RepID=A0A6P5TZU4_PRUAV|nr:7-deoxyloganetin glucosyltransferase-like [Prunus avium]
MSSVSVVNNNKPHVVCTPLPFQSHIKAMLKFAKLLHHKGFHITFVNTEFNHKRFLRSLGPNSLNGLPDFRYESISDGLPISSDTDDDGNTVQDIPLLLDSIRKNLLAPFRNLLRKLNDTASSSANNNIINNPPVTCMVSDGFVTSTITAAGELGIPVVLFFTIAAAGFMGSKQYSVLVEKGLAPLKDESCLTNGFLDKVIDWVPGMEGIRLRDLPSCFRTTDPDDIVFNFAREAMDSVDKASAVVVHTFDKLEPHVLDAISSMPPPVYAIGPLQLLLNHLPKDPLNLKPMGYSLWKEETECLQWLNSKAPNSVVYVNFGSLVVMAPQQLVEFGWGLANSKLPFLWVIRPDLIVGESAILPPEFEFETKERGLIASWCPQEQVLNHPSVGGFLTHSGWNSTIESLTAGVPMLCWPVFAEQHTNCYYTCNEWGSGLEIDNNVKRDEVEKLVRELMEGEKGKKMKIKAMEWKKLAEEATGPHGSSSINMDNLVNQMLLRKK